MKKMPLVACFLVQKLLLVAVPDITTLKYMEIFGVLFLPVITHNAYLIYRYFMLA